MKKANSAMTKDELEECHRLDPEGYEANLFLGLLLSSDRANMLKAEPYLLKALSHGNMDEYSSTVLERLSWTNQIRGNYQQSVSLLDLAIKIAPNNPALVLQKGHALFQFGDSDKAFAIFKKCSDLLFQRAEDASKNKKEPVTHLLEPHRLICIYIGEMAAKLDLYLKARELGLINGEKAILCAPDKFVVNRAFANYWAEHVDIVFGDDPAQETFEQNRDYYVVLDYYTVPDGRTLQRDLAHRVIQKMWEDLNRPPLLKIKPEHREKGRQLLSDAGMPEDAWFVCLHVREAGFFKENVSWGTNWHRNADITTYYAAIEEITKRGGWVVRIGDRTMVPLPPMNNVIDLALSPERQDWMDIFAIAESKFYMGMASGPAGIPPNFGVPILGTNWFAMGSWPFCRDDLFIPKLFRDKDTGRTLSIAEATAPPFYSALEPLLFECRGVEVVDNTAEELAEATVEMIERLDGLARYSEEEERNQNAFKEMADPYNLGMEPRVGQGFLRLHPELIGK